MLLKLNVSIKNNIHRLYGHDASVVKISFLIFVLFLIRNINSASVENENLPKMYQMDNYADCDKSSNRYCIYEFKIEPTDPKSNLWKMLEKFRSNRLKLDRRILNRMMCVPQGEETEIYGVTALKYELKRANISIEILSLECEKDYSFFYFKIFFGGSLLIYLVMVFNCTWYHHKRNAGSLIKNTWYETWYPTFSLIKNIQRLLEDNKNQDFQRLKSIQGIRVFNTMVVVFWHTVLSLFQLYIESIEEIEKNYENSLFFYLMFIGAFCVQTFFLISAFLLTNQVYELKKKNGSFSCKHCGVLLVNRFFRFLPTLLVILAGTKLELYDNSPHTVKSRNMCLPICQQYWLYTVFQINFLLSFEKICTPGLWYLSVDTVFYILTIAVLYLILKFNLSLFKIVGSTIIAVSLYFGLYIYINDYDFMFQPFPEAIKTIMENPSMTNVYISPMASWSSSLFGVILGYIYFNNKDTERFQNRKSLEILWWPIFTCIPPLAVYLSSFSYFGLSKLIMAAIIKPLFVFPLGVGILGMAFGLGGIVRKFLESKMLLVISNVTYCTYVFHFFIVFAKGALLTEMLNYKAFHMISWVLFDIIASFSLGAICTILVEYPGLSLQKTYIPQIGKKLQRTKEK